MVLVINECGIDGNYFTVSQKLSKNKPDSSWLIVSLYLVTSILYIDGAKDILACPKIDSKANNCSTNTIYSACLEMIPAICSIFYIK